MGIDAPRSLSTALKLKRLLAASKCSSQLVQQCSTGFAHGTNATIGTYAPHLFGHLANVFAKSHLEAVTRAYNHIHEIIFDADNLTDHVKTLLSPHLPASLADPQFALETLIHLSHAYGGLGVKTPYIALDLARNILPSPECALQSYLKAEKVYYTHAASKFHALTTTQRDEKLNAPFNNDAERITAVVGNTTIKDNEPTDTAVFPTLAALTAPPRTRHLCLPLRPSFPLHSLASLPRISLQHSSCHPCTHPTS